MKSIYEHIQDLKTEEWDYYFPNEEFLNIQNWSDNDEHKRFIEKYLQRGQKEEVLKHFNFSLQDFKREAHTNSVFFLGCVFYKELNLPINFKRKDNREEFYFIWFLTSLVHDFGYQIENCSNTRTDLSQKITNEINSFKSFYKIDSENDLLNTNYPLEPNTKILLDHVPKYFEARKNGELGRNDSGKIDHGIAAGLLLFDFLLKNRREKEESNSIKEKNRQETDGLFWGKELENFYAIASSAIATHNMRRGHKETNSLNEILEENKMEKLIINDIEGNIKKLSFVEDSFAFLFALADTLEPLKFYDNCFDIDEILKSIYLKINSNEIIFENKNIELDFKLFTKSVKSLKDWIDVDTPDITNENQIILKIKKSK